MSLPDWLMRLNPKLVDLVTGALESCEKERQMDDCRILIAQETLDYLHAGVGVEAWGDLHLKGKQHPVRVYRVLGLHPPPDSTEARSPHR